MGRICAVPKCKSGYRSCKEKVSIFKIPTDKLESWKKIIPRLTSRDNICEKHFRTSDIIREIKTDAFTYAIKTPKLAPDAMPTKFPTSRNYELRKKFQYKKDPYDPFRIKSIKPESVRFMRIKPREEPMADCEIAMKRKFMPKILEDRHIFPRSGIFTKLQYDKQIDQILRAKQSKSNKFLALYDVVDVGGVKKLTASFEKQKPIQFYVPDEELFDVIHEAHISMKHARAFRMVKELREHFKNITYRDIIIYIEFCPGCSSAKKDSIRIRTIKKPAIHYNAFTARCDLNIVDFQKTPDRSYRFILIYQNHATKFCILKALKTTRGEEIYSHLCNIFTVIGVPKLINSHISVETLETVIMKLNKKWPQLLIEHIKSERNYELTERISEDVEAWMEAKFTNRWSEGLRFVQLSINTDLDDEINSVPYEMLFETFNDENENKTIEKEETKEYAIKEEPIESKMDLEGNEIIENYKKEENIKFINICGICENNMERKDSCSCEWKPDTTKFEDSQDV